MKKTLKILLALSIVGSMFAIGFAGNAAAQSRSDRYSDNQYSSQVAASHVDQDQGVIQHNRNRQDDNVAFSGAFSASPRDGVDSIENGRRGSEAESGDATAIQASAQSNRNSQFAWSNAQNSNEQEQED